ncbi:MAG: hypothetical protein GX937_08160 [Lentisphaerae bacterium]|jgi:hypothetical protein|nr:hypothetical protein [Lentisphaerota bacterium]
MRKETFNTLRRMVEDDPLTESQIRIITGDATRILVDCATAAEMLGVTPATMRRLPVPRVKTNSRRVQFRLCDIHAYMDNCYTAAPD